VTDKQDLIEQVRHCQGAPFHWGPRANCPCCPPPTPPPVGGTGTDIGNSRPPSLYLH